MNESIFYQQADEFLNQIFRDLAEAKVQVKDEWQIDHVCYRVETPEHYQVLRGEFLTFSDLLIESEVGGRLISTFKLRKPLVFRNWSIGLVELPAPKRGKKTITGFEHLEVVCDLSFDELRALYSHLPLDTKGLEKEINPELEIVLGDRNIKFHHQSLEEVINLEKNLEALQKKPSP